MLIDNGKKIVCMQSDFKISAVCPVIKINENKNCLVMEDITHSNVMLQKHSLAIKDSQ